MDVLWSDRSPGVNGVANIPRRVALGDSASEKSFEIGQKLMIQKRNFQRLSFCFILFSAIAAMLVGLGQESWYLPILVCTTAVTAYYCTDLFGLIYLPRYLVYTGMIAGALLAGYEYFTQMRANQLLWVGNLLVYVQIPLYFQKKEKRVFEQWGVFLLLELVVAALVNDNVLYGVMMLPVLAVGSAALIALAEYASYQRHNESHSESTSLFARLLHWLGVKKLRAEADLD